MAMAAPIPELAPEEKGGIFQPQSGKGESHIRRTLETKNLVCVRA